MSTWILLRGLTREARHWGDFPIRLRSALPEAEVASVELPGCGSLHATISPTRIEAIAEACRAQALAKALKPPYHLLALSLGGMVAIAWARTHPAEVAGCVLVNTSLRSISPLRHRLKPRAWPSLLRLVFSRQDRSKEDIILRLTSRRADELQRVLEDWIAYRRERPVSLANAMRQLLAAMRFQPAGKPPVPLLVLASGRDQLVNPECSRRLAQEWQTVYAEHPDGGHDLTLDDGRWVAEQVCRWRRQLDKQLGIVSRGGTPL